jgi:cytochrome c-type biogenesis protein CcmH/NrfG
MKIIWNAACKMVMNIEDNKKSSFDTFQVIMHQVLKVIIFQLTILPYMHWGRYSAQKNSQKITADILTPFSELLPNLYYSPIKKLENIFIFKITRQQHQSNNFSVDNFTLYGL